MEETVIKLQALRKQSCSSNNGLCESYALSDFSREAIQKTWVYNKLPSVSCLHLSLIFMRLSLFLSRELLMSHRFLETQVLLRSINLHEFSLVTSSLHILESELAQITRLATKTDNLR